MRVEPACSEHCVSRERRPWDAVAAVAGPRGLGIVREVSLPVVVVVAVAREDWAAATAEAAEVLAPSWWPSS